jgi:hypothetical protein
MRVLKKIKPNLWESLQFAGLEVIQPTIDMITQEAYAAGECGDTKKYKALIGAGNRIYALFYYMMYIRRRLEEFPEENCKGDLPSIGKLECMLEGFRCYSTKVDIDMVSIFKELEGVFGVSAHEDCECCKGIGGFIIGAEDCKAWIIGGCESNQPRKGDYNNDYSNDFNVFI